MVVMNSSRGRVGAVELTDQITLQYFEQGELAGCPLILLHGYADSWRSFEPVLAHLPNSIHAYAITQRGHGDSSRPPTGYSPQDSAMDLAAFLDAINLGAVVIAGGSSGGVVARRFAIDYPQRTSGLILMGAPLTLHDKEDVLELWDSTISKLRDPIDPHFVRGFMEGTLAQKVPQGFLETMLKESLKVPARVWRATLEGLLRDDSSEHLSKIRAPTLLIWGDRDSVIARIDQQAMVERIKGSRLLVYPGAGHALYWEEPARIASDIEAFIRDLT